MGVVSIQALLEAGVHFGHQTRRWNPKMRRFIHGPKNGIYIIDLRQTNKLLDRAYNTVRSAAATGKQIVFIGTKKQAQEIVREEAERCNMHFVNTRWLGGCLTNWATIYKRIQRLQELERDKEQGLWDRLPKKEVAVLEKELTKLDKLLGGMKTLRGRPDMLFIVDPKKEHIAVNEARKLNIPIVGMVDTNCDPDEVDHVIPSNDDAIRSIRLICSTIANAVLEGKQGEQHAKNEAATEAASV